MKKIDSRSWMAMHPYVNMCDTDSYYLLIAEDISQTVQEYLKELPHVSKNEIEWIACCIAAYFEDRTSGINLFRSLNKLHYIMYKRYLPFYRADSRYDLEGINAGDVSFVIWNCLQQIQIYNKDAVLISPYAKEVLALASKVYPKLRKLSNKGHSGTNYLARSYYYMFDTHSVDDVLDRIHTLKTRTYLLSSYEDFLRFKENGAMVATRPCEEIDMPIMLGLYPHQWYAQMISFYRKEHSLLIDDIEILPLDSYLYEFTGEGKQVFSSVTCGRYIHLDLSKYLDPEKLVPGGQYLHSALIKYNNKWELVPPVQITRTKESTLRPMVEEMNDPSVYVIKNPNKRLNALCKDLNVKCFESTDDLLSFFKDQRISDELKERFAGLSETNYVLYPKNQNSIYVLRGVALFVNSARNLLYDKQYAKANLPGFMGSASENMKKIMINMIMRGLVTDLTGVEDSLKELGISDNIQFISSYLIQHLYNDKS